MAGPSDAFFVLWAEAARSPLVARLPELRARQAAAAAQGQPVTLAELAARLGLLPAAHLPELARMEARYAAASPAPSPAASPPSPSPAPAATPPTRRPSDRQPRPTPRPDHPDPEAVPPRPSLPPVLLALGVLALVAIAVVSLLLSRHRPPTPTLASTPAPSPSSTAPPRPTPTPSRAPDEDEPPPPRTDTNGDAAHREAIERLVTQVAALAAKGDLAGARRKFLALRAGAEASDSAAVARAQKDLDALEARAPKDSGPESATIAATPRTPTGSDAAATTAPAPEPSAAPEAANRASALYADLRKQLDPLLARFDTRGARTLLDGAPALEGPAAGDLEDDRAAPDALDRLLALAEDGARKAVGQDGTYRLAAGGAVTGAIRSVDGQDVTIAGDGGEVTLKVPDLDRRDLCALAKEGTPRADRDAYWLGRGLAFYYAGDLEAARLAFKETTQPLARRFLDRIERDAGPEPTSAAAPAKPSRPKPEPAPSASNPTPAPAVDVASLQLALQKLLHTPVLDEGGGRFGLVYDCENAKEAQDWEARGAEQWTIAKARKPGDQGGGFTCAQLAADGDAAVLHRVPAHGDFDLSCTFYLQGAVPGESVLLFVAGFEKKRYVAAQFGQALVRSDGRRLVAAPGPDVDLAQFGGAKEGTVRLVRAGDQVTLSWNGKEQARLACPGCDGRWGFIARHVKVFIRKVEMHSFLDLPRK